jgi:methylglutaconyl-CoA hydratase
MTDSLIVKVSGPVATVTLARPDRLNAIDAQLATNLTQAFQKIGVADAIRVVVLDALGKSFCGGLDPDWMKPAAGADIQHRSRDAMQAAMVLDAIDRCPKPVVAKIQGSATGLGVGLVAAADIAIAKSAAGFTLNEVRYGLTPSLAAPYLTAAIGARALRRYALSGERMDAKEALRLGLIHELVPEAKLDDATGQVVAALLDGQPKAQIAAKDMLRVVDDSPMGPDLMRYAAGHFAEAMGALARPEE